MFHGFQPTDHGLDAGAHLLVLLQEARAIVGESFVTLAECTILLLELHDAGHQLLDTAFEACELQIELCSCCVVHANDYGVALLTRSIKSRFMPFRHNAQAMQTASYADIQRVLADERSMTDAAEAHGTLVGALCTAAAYRFEDWLQEILPEGRAETVSNSTLRGLYFLTSETLAGQDLEFQPLLPEDAQPLDERTAALAQWCVGFLYGLGSGSIQDLKTLPGEVGEVVRDFDEITRVGVDGGETDEQNESAYAELVEFVRVGVQLVFEELEPLRDEPSAEQPDPPLH